MCPFTIVSRCFSLSVVCDSSLELSNPIKLIGIMKCDRRPGCKTDTKHLFKFLSLKYCQYSDCSRGVKFITNLFDDFSENHHKLSLHLLYPLHAFLPRQTTSSLLSVEISHFPFFRFHL